MLSATGFVYSRDFCLRLDEGVKSAGMRLACGHVGIRLRGSWVTFRKYIQIASQLDLEGWTFLRLNKTRSLVTGGSLVWVGG